jgi:hypothetical protein
MPATAWRIAGVKPAYKSAAPFSENNDSGLSATSAITLSINWRVFRHVTAKRPLSLAASKAELFSIWWIFAIFRRGDDYEKENRVDIPDFVSLHDHW